MPAIPSSASAKAILLGEHAVVYGYPALAVPLPDLRVRVHISPGIGLKPESFNIKLESLGLNTGLSLLADDHPIKKTVTCTLQALGIKNIPTLSMTITHSFPLSAGLGGSAAISIAICRALSAFLGHPLPEGVVNQIAYKSELSAHGTPSGLDNTVISLEKPILFRKNELVETLKLSKSIQLLVVDSGVAKNTKISVAQVGSLRETNLKYFTAIMHGIEIQVMQGKVALEQGDLETLGSCMNANQSYLDQLKLSCPEIDRITGIAQDNRAYGAKLTGGGLGGCVIVLPREDHVNDLISNLKESGFPTSFPVTLGGRENA